MRSGLTSSIAALALAFTLAGCDQIQKMTGGQPPSNTSAGNTTVTTSSAPAAPGAMPDKPVGGDPALATEMQAAAAQLQATLPIQVDQITRVVGVRAEGTEFVYDLTITQPIPAAQIDLIRQTMQRTNQTNMCANPQVATFIRRGGSMNHRYVDTAGSRFETRVVSC